MPWLTVALLVGAVALALWWLSARRAEAPAPPASVPGARTLSEAPGADEITHDEKADLQRIIRERGAPTPAL